MVVVVVGSVVGSVTEVLLEVFNVFVLDSLFLPKDNTITNRTVIMIAQNHHFL